MLDTIRDNNARPWLSLPMSGHNVHKSRTQSATYTNTQTTALLSMVFGARGTRGVATRATVLERLGALPWPPGASDGLCCITSKVDNSCCAAKGLALLSTPVPV